MKKYLNSGDGEEGMGVEQVWDPERLTAKEGVEGSGRGALLEGCITLVESSKFHFSMKKVLRDGLWG